MTGAAEATDAATWRDPELRTVFLDTLDYQAMTSVLSTRVKILETAIGNR